MEFPKRNFDKVAKIIEYNTLVDLYYRNKNNPEQSELINKVSNKFNELFNSDIAKSKSQHKYIEAYVIPEGTELSKEYINQVTKICNSVGVNVLVDPEHVLVRNNTENPITKNDYVLITHQEYLQQGIDRINGGAGTFILLDSKSTQTEADYNIHGQFGPNSINSALLKDRKINNPSQSVGLALVVEKNSKLYQDSINMMNMRMAITEVPDAPLVPDSAKKWATQVPAYAPPLKPIEANLDAHSAVSLDNLAKYIEADIMVELYHRNKNNPEKAELIENLKEKFSNSFEKNNDITKSYEAKYISTYVIPEKTNISQIYLAKAHEICKDLGINISINPKGNINKDEYVILSTNHTMNISSEKLNQATGVSLVLDHLEIAGSGPNIMPDVLKKLKSKDKNISMILITDAGSDTHNEIVNNPQVASKVFAKSVPEAPVVKNVWDYGLSNYKPQNSSNLSDKIKNIRDNLNSPNSHNQQNKLGS